jgi:hypothetical protein
MRTDTTNQQAPRRDTMTTTATGTIVIGLAVNNVSTRWDCHVPDELVAPRHYFVEKSDVPLTPQIVGCPECDAPDVCWPCFEWLAPELVRPFQEFSDLAREWERQDRIVRRLRPLADQLGWPAGFVATTVDYAAFSALVVVSP